MSADPFAPIAGGAEPAPAKPKLASTSIMPVPDGAPTAPASHPKLGKPSKRWEYRDAAGALLGYACRFDTGEGKEFRPLTYARRGTATEWRWETWSGKRPLYGLQGLAQRPDAPVVITEGEKAADAATGLLPAMAVVTSPGGAKSAGKADWSVLRGRQVTVWPDSDIAGLDYAQAVAKAAIAAGALGVAIVSPPSGNKVGWDAADALEEGWDEARAGALVAAAKPAQHKTTAKGGNGRAEGADEDDGGKRVPQSTVLLQLCEFCELWHDADQIAYATFPINERRENAEIRSTRFRLWLCGIYFRETGSAIRSQAYEDTVRVLEARAINDGPQYEPFLRIGHHNKNIYVDLGDPTWRAVEITRDEIKLVENPPVKFVRSPAMRPLSEPELGYDIDLLRSFINVSDDDFVLVVAWLVMAFRPKGPYPILVVQGEQGTGKSFVSRLLRDLIDPRAAPNRGAPKEDRDLVVSAAKSWVMTFDNLSYVANWLSDALCRLSTGSGFATRTLHSDREETIFEAARPIILNGIEQLTDRADLADRAVIIHLLPITQKSRRTEDEVLADFEQQRPFILGALLNAIRSAIANAGSVHLEELPRMADFAKFVTAAEPGLGWDKHTFINTYISNRKRAADATFEADAVAMAIYKFVCELPAGVWEGSATNLLPLVALSATDAARNAKTWPSTPTVFGNLLSRATPLLANKGVTVDRHHSTSRKITLTYKPPDELCL